MAGGPWPWSDGLICEPLEHQGASQHCDALVVISISRENGRVGICGPGDHQQILWQV